LGCVGGWKEAVSPGRDDEKVGDGKGGRKGADREREIERERKTGR